MSMRPLRVLLIVAAALLGPGCDRGDDARGASTATSTVAIATAASEPALTSTAPSPARPPATPPGATPSPGSLLAASTVVLVDVVTGEAKTLYADSTQAAWSAAFVDGDVVVSAGERALRFGLDGSPVSGSLPAAQPCRNLNGMAEIAGRQYGGVTCGAISPDGRRMVYLVQTGEVDAGTSGPRVPQHDMWLLAIDSGATTRLQTGLIHCGGCDARYGPRWSPSSRYVAYAESGGQGRRFLSDVTTGTTRQIGSGNEITDAPSWSPRSDVLAYSTTSHGTTARLEDLASRTSRDLTVQWPVQFDATGIFLYSPAWASPPKSGTPTVSTVIVDVQTDAVAGTLSGAPPPEFLWSGSLAVTETDQGYLAVLQQAGGCNGTAIYRRGIAQPQCITGGAQGQIAPGGSWVAVARETGQTGPVHGAQFSSTSMPRYDIDVIDAGTGRARTVVNGTISFIPPLMRWNAAGTHLLVLWPQTGGL